MAQFIISFRKLDKHEGEYGNDPDDPGGETYRGIARKMNGKWDGWAIIDSLKRQSGFPANLSLNVELRECVGTFYLANFWNKIDGDDIQNQDVADSIFDFAVNAGVGTSIQLAQKVVKTNPDGSIGPNTLKAINAFNPDHFIAAFTVAKIRRYIEICKKRDTSRKYFFGWVIRAVSY